MNLFNKIIIYKTDRFYVVKVKILFKIQRLIPKKDKKLNISGTSLPLQNVKKSETKNHIK